MPLRLQVAMSFCDSAQERRTDTSKGGKAKLPLLASQVREMVGLRALGVYVRGLSLLSQSASHHSSMVRHSSSLIIICRHSET